MTLDTFGCPECGVRLRRLPALRPGTRVQCPQCGMRFVVPPEDPTEEPLPPPAPFDRPDITTAPARRDIRPAREGEGDDEDYPFTARRFEGELRNDYPIDISKWLTLGARHWGALIGPFIGYAFIILLMLPLMLVPLLGLFFLPHMMAGPFIVALRMLKGQSWKFGDFFSGFNWYSAILGQTLLLVLIGMACSVPVIVVYAYTIIDILTARQPLHAGHLLLILGACMLALPVSIYFTVRYYWALWLVLDRNYGAVESLAGSWKLTRGRFWMTFVVWLLMQAIVGAGSSLCLVGVLASAPLAVLVPTAGYLLIAGTRPPIDEPEPPRQPRRRDEF